jgi:hypothetical protein
MALVGIARLSCWKEGMVAMAETNSVDLVRRLVERIETGTFTLHRSGSYLTRCRRVNEGIAQTEPEDCTCGLDALLAKARAFTGDQATGGEPPAMSQNNWQA